MSKLRFNFVEIKNEKDFTNIPQAAVGRFSTRGIKLYHELLTDTMFVFEKKSGLRQLLDPETGLPLTYKKCETLIK